MREKKERNELIIFNKWKRNRRELKIVLQFFVITKQDSRRWKFMRNIIKIERVFFLAYRHFSEH